MMNLGQPKAWILGLIVVAAGAVTVYRQGAGPMLVAGPASTPPIAIATVAPAVATATVTPAGAGPASVIAAAPAAAASPTPAPTAMPITTVIPSFDVVRVAPSGTAVLAGRAEPGAQVTVRDGPAIIGQTMADSRGEWVVVPGVAIEPGGRALTLTVRNAAGNEVQAADTLMIIVPPRPVAVAQAAPPTPAQPTPEPAIALAITAQGPARLLQAAPGGVLAMQQVDYDENGAIRFAGTATPSVRLRLYIDNTPAGEVMADAMGKWALIPLVTVAQGVHTLRLDQIGDVGVQSRIEIPFQRDAVPARLASAGATATATTPANLVVVQPGQNLWRLARTAYGEGTRYTLIYTANQGQIRDPNLIYPGQAFALPNQ